MLTLIIQMICVVCTFGIVVAAGVARVFSFRFAYCLSLRFSLSRSFPNFLSWLSLCSLFIHLQVCFQYNCKFKYNRKTPKLDQFYFISFFLISIETNSCWPILRTEKLSNLLKRTTTKETDTLTHGFQHGFERCCFYSIRAVRGRWHGVSNPNGSRKPENSRIAGQWIERC